MTITNYYYREEAKVLPVELKETTAESLPCPYRGLFHFGPNDAEVFFGREIFIEELYSATKTRNFIPVLGASGSGKSSVVLAGLVPKLQQEGHWKFTHFRPGSDPFHALALALVPLYTPELDDTEQIAQARKLAGYLGDNTIPLSDVFAKIKQNCLNHRVLLIADQFEELYTLCKEEIQRKFLDCLLTCLGNSTSPSSLATVLVTTMRADFLGNALAYPEFADQLREADVKIRSMNSQELRSVIEKPVERLGVTFEAGLVERILNDVEEQPGNLPLLEFALTELWNKRTGKQLTHQVYEDIGEVEGALARHADDKYGNLTDEEKEKVRRIFIQLVRPGEGTEDTRRIALKEELGEQSWSLVTQLADARLVVTSRNGSDQETVEVVHEALIRNWDELQAWMNTDRVFRAWQERLRGAKEQWEATNQDPGSLLRGAALVEAKEKLSERPEDLIYETEFIQQSIQDQERLNKEKEARRRREVRTAWGIAVGSLVAVAISTGLFLRGRYQQKQAELGEADSLARYSLSLFNEGKELDASLEAIRAGKILQKHKATDPELMSALISNVYHSKERNRLQNTGSVISVSFSPDGKTLASGSSDKTIKLWDVETGEEITTLSGHDDSVRSISFSPNGKTLASGSSDYTIKLWDVETGEEITSLPGGSWNIDVSFNPDGKILASTYNKDFTIKLWDVETGEEIASLPGHDDYVQSISFSPNGKTLASGSSDKTIKLWDVETGEEITSLPGHDDSVWSVSFSPDGKTLTSGSSDDTIKLWDVETGEEIATLLGHDHFVYSVRFSPDGKTLASGSFDDTIKLWDVETGKEITSLLGHDDEVTSVSFSPDGKTLASGSIDRTIKLWDVQTQPEITSLLGHDDHLVESVSFSPDGKTLASGSWDNTIKLWDVETGEEIATLLGHDDEVYSVSFSPDGKTLAAGSTNGTIKLWDVETGKEIASLSGHDDFVLSVRFSPDGKTLASGSWDNTIKLWDVETGKEIASLLGHDDEVNSVSFSPDEKMLASGSKDGTIKLWDVETQQQITTLLGHDGNVLSVRFSPDGKTLAAGSTNGTIKLWDVETQQQITTLLGHDDSVNSVSFSPDGKMLASGSEDNTIKLWNLDLNFLMERSCDRVRNYLLHNPNVTEEEKGLCNGIGTEK
ncbi:MAG: hypothetical protein F6J96_06610 [Symploca sp. SIO1C2]|nr:hypothetical protein [Symploca sp. SIO1C2]